MQLAVLVKKGAQLGFNIMRDETAQRDLCIQFILNAFHFLKQMQCFERLLYFLLPQSLLVDADAPTHDNVTEDSRMLPGQLKFVCVNCDKVLNAISAHHEAHEHLHLRTRLLVYVELNLVQVVAQY